MIIGTLWAELTPPTLLIGGKNVPYSNGVSYLVDNLLIMALLNIMNQISLAKR